MISKFLEDLAAHFWQRAGDVEHFPRDLTQAILFSDYHQINFVPLVDLCPNAIRKWLHARGCPVSLETQERWLNGCLWAYEGRQTIFYDAGLVESERRMVVSHEFGHFLADYEAPRERIRRRLGPGLLAVLDGKQNATPAEQLGATLAGVELGAHVHFMDRAPGGTYSEAVNLVEKTANDLAFELIAPWRTALEVMKTQGGELNCQEGWAQLLQSYFGLPSSWGNPYRQQLMRYARGRRTFSEVLGL